MKTYHQNGTITEELYIMDESDVFAIQNDTNNGHNQFFYPGDTLIRKLDLELAHLSDEFVNLYFSDLELYYRNLSILPVGLLLGGQNSDISINKNNFLDLADRSLPFFDDLYRYLYVGDCQYLVYTVQNLLSSAEHCYLKYYIEIAQIDCQSWDLGKTIMVASQETMQLLFYLETFFIKLYSVLDLIVKIIYELENPIESFSNLTRLNSAGKLWGDRKRLNINKHIDTIFEDCEIIKMIESIRNEVVHNGTWEFRPKVFLKVQEKKIVERYMMFPDFDEGRLSSIKNRRHFFSTETKVNDMLVLIHDEFYQRLLTTLQDIKQNINCKINSGNPHELQLP